MRLQRHVTVTVMSPTEEGADEESVRAV